MHVIQTIQKLLAFKASMAVRVRSKISLEDLTCFSVVTGWTNWNLETQQRYSNDAIWLEMARLEVAVCWILGHWEDVMCLRGLVLGKVAGSGKISSNRVTNDAEFQVETWADLTERDRGAKCTKDNELVASPRSSSKNSEESKEMILTGLRINFS